jgi:ABC-type antimicrobial peptide transport system permease subunit
MLIPTCIVVVLVTALLLIGKVPLSYNLRNLTVRWKTALMTVLAFTMVIWLMTVMLAFVNGMYLLTENSGQPGNVVILSEGATDEVLSNLPAIDLGDLENQQGIVRENGRPLASRETYMIVIQPVVNAKPGGVQNRFMQIRATNDPLIAARVHSISLYPGGKWFSSAGVQELKKKDGDDKHGLPAIQVVLGEGMARQLGRDRMGQSLENAGNHERLDLGDTFDLCERTVLVVGVMQSAGSSFDSEIWAKQSIVGPMLGKDNYSSVIVRTADADAAKRFENFINNSKKDENKFGSGYTKANLHAQTETDYYSSLGDTNMQFLYAVVFVTVVMAVGGIFGVMNTMFAAINQRIKDIGVLRLLGYARSQILVSFLLESLVMALVGGLLGCALGTLADGWSANSVVSGGPGHGKFVVLKLTIDAQILGAGMFLAIAMGMLGGLLPALSAMRLKPLEALK